jgi:hypothetical protein
MPGFVTTGFPAASVTGQESQLSTPLKQCILIHPIMASRGKLCRGVHMHVCLLHLLLFSFFFFSFSLRGGHRDQHHLRLFYFPKEFINYIVYCRLMLAE